jgi:hypothetical protein
MRNHLHLLLEVGTTPLSKIMQVLQFRYTRYFNRRYGKEGHLFQDRYKAILCDKDPYLVELVRYIHLNPVRSGIVADIENYQWVSHGVYVGKGTNHLIDDAFILGRFGRSQPVARRKYREFLVDGLDLGHQEKYYQVKDQRFLGEDEFVEQVESGKGLTIPDLFAIPLHEIAATVAENLGISSNRIYSFTRDRRGAQGRSVVAYLARELAGYRVKDIADHFHREPVTISEAVLKLEERLGQDKELAQKVEAIRQWLAKRAKKKYRITDA